MITDKGRTISSREGQFNKVGGVWIFLISRESWTGPVARDRPSETSAAGELRDWEIGEGDGLPPLSYFKKASPSAIHVMPREMHSTPPARTHQLSIGVEAPLLRELLTVSLSVSPSLSLSLLPQPRFCNR